MKTLKDLKVGDTAYDVLLGEVRVTNIITGDDYPIKVKDCHQISTSYTFEGKLLKEHLNPSLYLTNPLQQQGKWMMVSDNNRYWKKRFVFAEKCGKYIAWDASETDEEVEKELYTIRWSYAKEIEEETVPEYTMEELVAKLGNFKIKK